MSEIEAVEYYITSLSPMNITERAPNLLNVQKLALHMIPCFQTYTNSQVGSKSSVRHPVFPLV